MAKKDITFPVGRLVQGSLYKGNTTDSKGQPLKVKTGPNAGQPMTQFYFAVAIAKTPGHSHWAQTDWGQQVLQAGAEGYPGMYQNPAFSWKIEDGDSAIPNKNNRKPCENEGWPGHWVVKFAGSASAPRVFQRDQTGRPVDYAVDGAVKLGYFIQVGGECVDNKPSESPGVYMNYRGVLFVGAGPEIFVGPDANAMFGAVAGPLPAGVLPVPQGVAAMPVMAAPAAAAPALPGMPSLPAVAAPVALPPTMVVPQPAFLGVPTVGAPVGLPAVAAVAPAMQMPAPLPVPAMPAAPAGPTPTTKLVSSGYSYQQMRDAGWTDAALRQEQYIV